MEAVFEHIHSLLVGHKGHQFATNNFGTTHLKHMEILIHKVSITIWHITVHIKNFENTPKLIHHVGYYTSFQNMVFEKGMIFLKYEIKCRK